MEFRCTSITSTTATVSWKSFGDDLEHKLSWQTTSGVVNFIRLSNDRKTYTIKKLDPATTYKLMIKAINPEINKESSAIFITVKTLVAGN